MPHVAKEAEAKETERQMRNRGKRKKKDTNGREEPKWPATRFRDATL
jgi:hypothetical protein